MCKKYLSLFVILFISLFLFVGCGNLSNIRNESSDTIMYNNEIEEIIDIEKKEKSNDINETLNTQELLNSEKFYNYSKMNLNTAESFMKILRELEQLQNNNNGNYIVKFFNMGENNIGKPILISANLNGYKSINDKAVKIWIVDSNNVVSFDYNKDTQYYIRDITINGNSLVFRVNDMDIKNNWESAGFVEYNVDNGQLQMVNKFFHYVFENRYTSHINSRIYIDKYVGVVLPDDKEYIKTKELNENSDGFKYIHHDDMNYDVWLRGKLNVNETYWRVYSNKFWHLLKENDIIYKFNTIEELELKSEELFMYYEEEKYSNKGNSFFVFDEVNSDLDDYVIKPLSLDDTQLLIAIGNLEEYIELLKKLNK